MLDGTGDLAALKMPSGRGAFIERMQAMMAGPARGGPRVISPQDEFVADIVQRLGEKALLVEERRSDDGGARLLVVLDVDAETLATEAARVAANGAVAVEIMDLHAWRAMRRLAAMGLLQFTREARELYRSVALPADALTGDRAEGSLNPAELSSVAKAAGTMAPRPRLPEGDERQGSARPRWRIL